MGCDEDEDDPLEGIAAQLQRNRHLARRWALFRAMSPSVPSWPSIAASFALLGVTCGTFLLWAHCHHIALLVLTLVLFCCLRLPITMHTRRRPPKAPPR